MGSHHLPGEKAQTHRHCFCYVSSNSRSLLKAPQSKNEVHSEVPFSVQRKLCPSTGGFRPLPKALLRSVTVHSDKRRLLGSPPSVSDGWLNESAFRSFLLQEMWRSLAQSLSHSWHLPGLLSSTRKDTCKCQPGCRIIARRASATITQSGCSVVAGGPTFQPSVPPGLQRRAGARFGSLSWTFLGPQGQVG